MAKTKIKLLSTVTCPSMPGYSSDDKDTLTEERAEGTKVSNCRTLQIEAQDRRTSHLLRRHSQPELEVSVSAKAVKSIVSLVHLKTSQ